jgi:predicted N-acyltransferase
MNWQWTSIDSIESLCDDEKTSFERLKDPFKLSSPFLKLAFLSALEKTQCVGGNTGWQPQHILIRNHHQELIAFLPAYIKTHSYGEYVFDHSWAHAYDQNDLDYYPKLIIAIPFTPVTGPRILVNDEVSFDQISEYLGCIQEALMSTLSVSSIHFLFPAEHVSNALTHRGFHQRLSVQFNWQNNDYTEFNDFMALLSARRRRMIKKERAGIAKQGVKVTRLIGEQISEYDMDFFYQCYRQTYLKRSGHAGYLRPEFFHGLRQDMPQNLMLVVAHRIRHCPLNSSIEYLPTNTPIDVKNSRSEEVPIAAALFLHDENGLYGRYWGALSEVSGLHFEACYYQGIEFCIEQGIPLFNPGTQGEHKILRGFAPTLCYSNHKMCETAFDRAVLDFLHRETPHIIDYAEKSADLLPYKAIVAKNES